MDPVAIVQMRGLLREIAEEGTAVLFSSHILSEVEQTADRIGILSGKTIAETFFISEKKAECGDGFENYIIRQMGGSYEVM